MEHTDSYNFSAVSAAAMTTAAPVSHLFIKLCLLSTALHRGAQVPDGCRAVITEENIREFQGCVHRRKHVRGRGSFSKGKSLSKERDV